MAIVNWFMTALEPEEWPDKEPEEILRDRGWPTPVIDTLRGRMICLYIAIEKVRRATWEEVFELKPGISRIVLSVSWFVWWFLWHFLGEARNGKAYVHPDPKTD